MATFTSDRAAKFLAILYLLVFFAATVIIFTIKVEYSPQSKVNFWTIKFILRLAATQQQANFKFSFSSLVQFMIAFDAGSGQTKGKLYEVRLEKSESGIMPINEITKCEINQGIHESVIPIESKEDEWAVHWPLNSEEENRNENADGSQHRTEQQEWSVPVEFRTGRRKSRFEQRRAEI